MRFVLASLCTATLLAGLPLPAAANSDPPGPGQLAKLVAEPSVRKGICLTRPVFGGATVVRVHARHTSCSTARSVYAAWLAEGENKDKPVPGWSCHAEGTPRTDDVDLVRCANGRARVRIAYFPASPPRSARIAPGVGMAGARIGQTSPPVQGGRYPGGRPFELWGSFSGGLTFCYEQSCAWDIPGGGKVGVQFDGHLRRVGTMSTSGARWTTSAGVGPGVAVAKVKRRHRSARPITTCQVSPFGAQLTGYILRRRGGWAFFEVDKSSRRVAQVWVGQGKVRNGC
jgi:hypothetical protein